MVTIRTFDNAVEAHLLKSRLQNEGIPAFVLDENIVTLLPLYNILVGGVKLCVSEFDLENAMRVVSEVERTELTDDSGNKIMCHACGSASFYVGFKTIRNSRGIVAYMMSMFFSVYPLYYKSVKRCKDCDCEF
jgi:hypothetical protein